VSVLLRGLTTLLVVSVIAALAPFVTGLLRGIRLPQVVVFIVGGVIAGPEVLGWADPSTITLLANVGLGFLFLMAGYELEPEQLFERAGRLAVWSWGVTAVLAVVTTGVLASLGYVHAFVPVAIALTTTSLGTLLPILRNNNMLGGAFGRYVMTSGAAGEFFPIIAIAVFLGANGKILGMLSLFVMAIVALALTVVPQVTNSKRLARIMRDGEHATSQTTLRWTIVMLFVLLVIARDFGLDVVLGAFLAGIVLRRWQPGDVDSLDRKLDTVGYGFFIPLFFVWSGMNLALRSIGQNPGRLAVFLVLLLLVRGAPTLLLYRRDLHMLQRVQLTLLTATALPLLVALSEIGLGTGDMLPQNAAALVGAGVLSVLIFPGAAVGLQGKVLRATAREAPIDGATEVPRQADAAAHERRDQQKS
jgi:Kef-type K+ transport system membrane component KefB